MTDGELARLWARWTGDDPDDASPRPAPRSQPAAEPAAEAGAEAGTEAAAEAGAEPADDGQSAAEIMVREVAEQGAVDAATQAAWDSFHLQAEMFGE